MATIAYDYGDIISVEVPDETGGVTHEHELILDMNRDETLKSAGYELIGGWVEVSGVYQITVEEA